MTEKTKKEMKDNADNAVKAKGVIKKRRMTYRPRPIPKAVLEEAKRQGGRAIFLEDSQGNRVYMIRVGQGSKARTASMMFEKKGQEVSTPLPARNKTMRKLINQARAGVSTRNSDIGKAIDSMNVERVKKVVEFKVPDINADLLRTDEIEKPAPINADKPKEFTVKPLDEVTQFVVDRDIEIAKRKTVEASSADPTVTKDEKVINPQNAGGRPPVPPKFVEAGSAGPMYAPEYDKKVTNNSTITAGNKDAYVGGEHPVAPENDERKAANKKFAEDVRKEWQVVHAQPAVSKPANIQETTINKGTPAPTMETGGKSKSFTIAHTYHNLAVQYSIDNDGKIETSRTAEYEYLMPKYNSDNKEVKGGTFYAYRGDDGNYHCGSSVAKSMNLAIKQEEGVLSTLASNNVAYNDLKRESNKRDLTNGEKKFMTSHESALKERGLKRCSDGVLERVTTKEADYNTAIHKEAEKLNKGYLSGTISSKTYTPHNQGGNTNTYAMNRNNDRGQ